MDYFIGYIIGLAIAFIIGVFITRWIFGIGKIIDALQRQNNLLEQQSTYNLGQLRMLKKMLLNQGTSTDEIDEIITKGNPKSENSN
jgi:hypothetical protein